MHTPLLATLARTSCAAATRGSSGSFFSIAAPTATISSPLRFAFSQFQLHHQQKQAIASRFMSTSSTSSTAVLRSATAAMSGSTRTAGSSNNSGTGSVLLKTILNRTKKSSTTSAAAASHWATTTTATACVLGPMVYSRFLTKNRVVHCDSSPRPIGTRSTEDFLDATGVSSKKDPLINSRELTFGMAMGLCSGYLVKKLGKLAMLIVGICFVSLQMLSNSGYIQVNWVKIEQRFRGTLDLDQDGKVTRQDAHRGFKWLIGLLTRNFQFKSTFTGGFVLGFRYG